MQIIIELKSCCQHDEVLAKITDVSTACRHTDLRGLGLGEAHQDSQILGYLLSGNLRGIFLIPLPN